MTTQTTDSLRDTADTDHDINRSMLEKFTELAGGQVPADVERTRIVPTTTLERSPRTVVRRPAPTALFIHAPRPAEEPVASEQDIADAALGPYEVIDRGKSWFNVKAPGDERCRSAVSSRTRAIQLCAKFNRESL